MQIYKYAITYDFRYDEFLTAEERTEFIVANNIKNYSLTEFSCTLPESIQDPLYTISRVVYEAMSFGKDLTLEFCAENVLLGITQAGMTDKVRTVLDSSFRAIETGSLYEALTKLKNVSESDKDQIFINNTRLLKYINKIEIYLNIELTVVI